MRVSVQTTGARYDVVVERGSLEHASSHLEQLVGERRVFVVADEGAWHHQGPRLEVGLEGLDSIILPMPVGEENKRLRQIESLADQMYAAGADRSSCVLAFGGGVTGDVGGFLAAAYMRGVEVFQVPTTLLAQVDSAVGGKTGVNLTAGKNLLGAFYQPTLVLVDPTTLETLPEREYRAGLFEVIKYGIIWSRSLFDLLRNEREAILAREPEILQHIIAESLSIKAAVVAQDEREGDLRRILNYGHTLGHALEAELAYRQILHGEAVGYGMMAAARLSESSGFLTSEDRQAIEEIILSYGPIPSLKGISAAKLVGRLQGDKKTIGGKVHFVLPDKVGRVRVVSEPDLRLVLEAAEIALSAHSGDSLKSDFKLNQPPGEK